MLFNLNSNSFIRTMCICIWFYKKEEEEKKTEFKALKDNNHLDQNVKMVNWRGNSSLE